MWSAANSLSCAERSPIMTAAPGSMFPDQRLPIVPSCRQHKSVRSQHWSIINPVRFLHPSSTHCMPAGNFPDGFLESLQKTRYLGTGKILSDFDLLSKIAILAEF